MPEPVPSSWLGAATPTALNSAATRLQASFSLGAHSTTVGKRLPPIPWTNGSGNEPTTAGIEFGLRPVVQVPPDVVAAVHGGAGRALLRPRSR